MDLLRRIRGRRTAAVAPTTYRASTFSASPVISESELGRAVGEIWESFEEARKEKLKNTPAASTRDEEAYKRKKLRFFGAVTRFRSLLEQEFDPKEEIEYTWKGAQQKTSILTYLSRVKFEINHEITKYGKRSDFFSAVAKQVYENRGEDRALMSEATYYAFLPRLPKEDRLTDDTIIKWKNLRDAAMDLMSDGGSDSPSIRAAWIRANNDFFALDDAQFCLAMQQPICNGDTFVSFFTKRGFREPMAEMMHLAEGALSENKLAALRAKGAEDATPLDLLVIELRKKIKHLVENAGRMFGGKRVSREDVLKEIELTSQDIALYFIEGKDVAEEVFKADKINLLACDEDVFQAIWRGCAKNAKLNEHFGLYHHARLSATGPTLRRRGAVEDASVPATSIRADDHHRTEESSMIEAVLEMSRLGAVHTSPAAAVNVSDGELRVLDPAGTVLDGVVDSSTGGAIVSPADVALEASDLFSPARAIQQFFSRLDLAAKRETESVAAALPPPPLVLTPSPRASVSLPTRRDVVFDYYDYVDDVEGRHTLTYLANELTSLACNGNESDAKRADLVRSFLDIRVRNNPRVDRALVTPETVINHARSTKSIRKADGSTRVVVRPLVHEMASRCNPAVLRVLFAEGGRGVDIEDSPKASRALHVVARQYRAAVQSQDPARIKACVDTIKVLVDARCDVGQREKKPGFIDRLVRRGKTAVTIVQESRFADIATNAAALTAASQIRTIPGFEGIGITIDRARRAPQAVVPPPPPPPPAIMPIFPVLVPMPMAPIVAPPTNFANFITVTSTPFYDICHSKLLTSVEQQEFADADIGRDSFIAVACSSMLEKLLRVARGHSVEGRFVMKSLKFQELWTGQHFLETTGSCVEITKEADRFSPEERMAFYAMFHPGDYARLCGEVNTAANTRIANARVILAGWQPWQVLSLCRLAETALDKDYTKMVSALDKAVKAGLKVTETSAGEFERIPSLSAVPSPQISMKEYLCLQGVSSLVKDAALHQSQTSRRI